MTEITHQPHAATRQPEEVRARWRRAILPALGAIALAALAIAAVIAIRNGADPGAWLALVWSHVAAIPPLFIVAACALKAAEVILNTGAWVAVVRAAFPDAGVTVRRALGVVQGGIAIVTVAPPKVGGVALVGLFRAAFPTLPLAALLASRALQSITATVAGLVALVLFGAATAGGEVSWFDNALAFVREQPLLAAGGVLLAVGLLVLLLRRGRDRLRAVGQHVMLSGAILRTPRRYALLVALPTALAFACRWSVTGVLMAAFGLPVTLETLVRVNVSHGLARSVQVTPGGVGTTTAFDLVALGGLAEPDAIVAYSLAQAAILLLFNVAFAVVAGAWAFGWRGLAGMLRRAETAGAAS